MSATETVIESSDREFGNAIARVVEYLWHDEYKDYMSYAPDDVPPNSLSSEDERQWKENPVTVPQKGDLGHIFEAVAVLQRWLNLQEEEHEPWQTD